MLLPIEALLVMAALRMGTGLRKVRLKAVALLAWGDDAGTYGRAAIDGGAADGRG